jgi:hypothetical protein
MVIAAMVALGCGAFSTVYAAPALGSVTGVLVTLSDLRAGVGSQHTITYTTSSSGALTAGIGQITVQFPAGTTVPASMAATDISVTTNASISPPTKVLTVAPVIDTSTRTVTMITPIVIGNNDVITVVFSSSAGLVNPITPQAYGSAASTRPLKVRTSADTVDVSPAADYNIAGYITFSPDSGAKRGGTVTVTAGGLAPSTTGNITVGTSTSVRGSATITANGTFSGSFIAVEETKDGGHVAVRDGAGVVVTSDGVGCSITCIAAATPLFVQKAGATPRVTTASPSSVVEVDLVDFTANASNVIASGGTTVGGLTTANVSAAAFPIPTGVTTSSAPYKFIVPASITTGTKNVIIAESGGGGTKSATFVLTITLATPGTLTLTPNVAVPGQAVTIKGSGFSSAFISGGAGPNGVHQVTGAGGATISLGGIILTAPHVTYPINLDSAGNLLVNIVIPIDSTTLVDGDRELKIEDSGGRTGTVKLPIPKRSIELEPATSRRGSTVKLNGAGFPATNPSISGSATVGIDYGGVTVTTVTTTATGTFQTTFQVPTTGVSIPSTNTVTATALGLNVNVSTKHSVPSASITVNPTSGSAGSQVTVLATNFPGFVTSSKLTIGNISVLPLPTPSSDGEGGFTTSFVVPQISLGAHVVSAVAGGVSALTNFTVVAPLLTPTPTPIPPAEPAKALETLVAADNLVRVWTFDNTTKEWSFFDPRPVFAAANSIKELVTGRVYWINVKSNQTSTLNGKERSLFAGWNTVAW